jgi:hypothetical protein
MDATIWITCLLALAALISLATMVVTMHQEQHQPKVSIESTTTEFARFNTEQPSFPVDVVFTWCKRTPEWIEARNRHVARSSTREPSARTPLTCDNPDDCEIHYAVKSIQHFMPWVRTIWILTQRPQDPHIPGTQVVFHDQVPGATTLPTFNSHSIEAFMHNIPGLADHFIYFNDDCFVGRPVDKSLFFTHAGQPIYYTTGKYAGSRLSRKPLSRYGYRHAWRNLSNLFHNKLQQPLYLQLHQASALSKEVCAAAASHPILGPYLSQVATRRLRDKQDIPPVGAALNLGVASGSVIVKPASELHHMEAYVDITDAFMKQLVDAAPQLFCLNSVSSSEAWGMAKHYLKQLFLKNE